MAVNLHQASRVFLRVASASGLAGALAASRWRQNRLLVLCYHGVSMADEHSWTPLMYVSPETFRRRLAVLRARRCNVLPLSEAVDLLYKRRLPPRSVAITFDDGFYNFYSAAWPILREFGFPATVYLTTYYVGVQHPVFDVAVDYLAWASRLPEVVLPEILGPEPRRLGDNARAVAEDVKKHCLERNYSAQQKVDVLAEFARRLSVDLNDVRRRRIVNLMSPSEVAELAAQGCDFQLHTHRHRVSRRPDRFAREIEENRARIREFTGRTASHFCYPGGYWLDEFPQWLRAAGVRSATTCDTGLATPRQNPYYLRRVLDINLPDETFEAWATGVAELASRHSINKSSGQLFADEEAPEERAAAAHG